MQKDAQQGRWDAVIIGAGVMGLFTAYHLRQRGVKRIAVVDKGTAGGVASPRAAGLLRCHYNHPLLVEMALRGNEVFASFPERFGSEVGYRQEGYVVCVKADQAATLAENVRMQKEMGVDVDLLTQDQIRAEFSEFHDLGDGVVAAYERKCAYAQPPAVASAMVRIVRESGVTVLEHTPVVGLESRNGAVCAVHLPSGSLATDLVINCAGAWAAHVGRMASLDLPVVAQRKLQIIEVERQGPADGPLRILSHEPQDLYGRPNGAHRVWIGGRVPFAPTTNPDAIDLLVEQESALHLRRIYQQLVRFNLGQITTGWAGVDGDTPDFQPILGPVDGLNGLYAAAGFSGHGFKLAPVVGQLIAEHVTAGKYLTLDATALGARRFAEGRPFTLGYKQMGA